MQHKYCLKATKTSKGCDKVAVVQSIAILYLFSVADINYLIIMKKSFLSLYSCYLIAISTFVYSKPIHDPLNIFCGSENCYDILGVPQNATIKDIKKAYRRISLTQHPDKNKEVNATETFRVISKAYEVVTGNESRPLFDYYLSHPKDYFKVSGQHYIQNLPKSDVRIVLTVALLLFSWLMHVIQSQKHERAVKYLKKAAYGNLGPKNGGTKQAMDLHKHATELYDAYLKEAKIKGDKTAGKVKMLKDPIFFKFIDQVLAEVSFDGAYRKPVWKDLLIVQVALLPYTIYLWSCTYYRRHISKQPIPLEDQIEMAGDRVGIATWEEFTELEKKTLLERQIWKYDVYVKWCEEREAEEARLLKSKSKKKNSKLAALSALDDEY
eukprot:gene8294-11224_t